MQQIRNKINVLHGSTSAFQKAKEQAEHLRKIKNSAAKHYQESLILETLLAGLKGI